jgi:hypothetical protein
LVQGSFKCANFIYERIIKKKRKFLPLVRRLLGKTVQVNEHRPKRPLTEGGATTRE